MTNLEEIGVIGAVFVAGYFVVVRIDQHTHERGDAIVTGTIGGVPMPTRNRRMMLFQHWMPNVAGQVGYLAAMLLVFYALAQNAQDQLARGIAYVCGGLCLFGALFWLILGPFYFFYLMSVIRETEGE